MQLVNTLIWLVVAAIVALVGYGFWVKYGPKPTSPTERSATPTEREEMTTSSPPEAPRRKMVKFMLREGAAGMTVLDLPTFEPEKEGGWTKDHGIVSIASVMAYTARGPERLTLVELDGKYMLVETDSGQRLMLREVPLTGDMEEEILQEREEAKQGDMSATFDNSSWTIKAFVGQDPATGRESLFTMLSVHPEYGKPDGPVGMLAPASYDEVPDHYYDLRARAVEGGDILFVFQLAGKVVPLRGRLLTEPELAQLTVV